MTLVLNNNNGHYQTYDTARRSLSPEAAAQFAAVKSVIEENVLSLTD